MKPKLPAKTAHILIVDDDPEIAKLIRFYLNGAGYILDATQNGQSALELLKEKKYDLILVDRMMPRMDGITFVNQTHNSGIHNGPVIIMSAHDQENKAILEISDIIYDILPKPFTSHRLKISIRNALEYKFLRDRYETIINSVINE